MKVLVEFDLTNSIHRDLFDKVKQVMLAHDRVDVTPPPQPSKGITREELMLAYRKAGEGASVDAAKELLAKLQVKYGEHLSDWTPEVMWMAQQQFLKLADNPAEFF